MAQNIRKDVLSVYKKILNVAKTWESRSGNIGDTLKERNYIKNEAKVNFRNNKFLKDTDEITKFLRDAETRLAIAIHYKNPYPRPVNVPPKTFIKPSRIATSKNDHSL